MKKPVIATVTKRYDNGAYLAETGDFAFGADHNGRIYWADAAGWSQIARDRDNFPAVGRPASYGFGHNCTDDEYTFAGVLVEG